jgi:predicted acyl esterase
LSALKDGTWRKFAQAGYLVVMFAYRGWGESDGRVILARPAAAEQLGNRFTAEVVELREIGDPHADVEDLFNVVHWLQAEPQSDTGRIGIWGTSFGGGGHQFRRRGRRLRRRLRSSHQGDSMPRSRPSNCARLIG